MRTLIKRVVMFAYGRGWIGFQTARKAFFYFGLKDF
jgi:hypothetical protein